MVTKPKKLSKEHIIIAITVIILFLILMVINYLKGFDVPQKINLTFSSDNNSVNITITSKIPEYNCTAPINKNGDLYCNIDNLTRIK